MRVTNVFPVWLCLILTVVWHANASETIETIMQKVEARYDCESLSADFTQTSIFAQMDIEDNAYGKAMFKYPDKIRWEYETPYPQSIISDGDSLWIYKPEENQVIVGKAEALMGQGKGASFLADIFSIRENFVTTMADTVEKEGCYVLRLEPKEEIHQLTLVYLFVSRETYLIREVETVNTFDEVTRIAFEDIKLNAAIDDAQFTFDIPIDADIVALDEPLQ
ncbi:MAG: outer membrane lipoprotein carrier protein LolA [Thermodesulfobacteriota bacterium]|nr:outer membrane lipoprotein carrier protein LolA [Thermodesulfobacteriota bacterium]